MRRWHVLVLGAVSLSMLAVVGVLLPLFVLVGYALGQDRRDFFGQWWGLVKQSAAAVRRGWRAAR